MIKIRSDRPSKMPSQYDYPLVSTIMESKSTSKIYSTYSCRAPATTMASTTMTASATTNGDVDANVGKERGKKELHVIKDPPATTTMKFKPAEILPKPRSMEYLKLHRELHYYDPIHETRRTLDSTPSFGQLLPPLPSPPASVSSFSSSSSSASSSSTPSSLPSTVPCSPLTLGKKRWLDYDTDKSSRQHHQRCDVLRRVRTAPVPSLVSLSVDKQCTVCEKHFTRARDMQRHIRSVHQDMKQYRCSCDCKFTRLDSLRRHQKNKACNDLRPLSASSSSPLKPSSRILL